MYRIIIILAFMLLCRAADAPAAEDASAPCRTDEIVSAMAMGRRGELIVATRGGTVSAIRQDGECVVLARDLGEASCVAVSARGDVFVGVMPGGRVIRVDRRGGVRIVAAGLDDIRALAVDRDAALFVSHGPHGAVSRFENLSGR